LANILVIETYIDMSVPA